MRLRVPTNGRMDRAGGERSGALPRGLGRLVSGLVWWVVAGLEARQAQPRRQTGPKERQGGIGLVWDRAFSEWSWWSLLLGLGLLRRQSWWWLGAGFVFYKAIDAR